MHTAAPQPSYFRLCPSCGSHNPPERLRCTCGAMLAGVDLRQALPEPAPAAPAAPTAPTATPAPAAAPEHCPFEDCAQPNPPGTVLCLYCNRPLRLPSQPVPAHTPGGASPGLLQNLPTALRERFRIQRQLPASGAEAELFIVEPLAGGPLRVAKIYRHGIHPRPEVQARLARIPQAYRVQGLESGLSEGFAYELMEFCPAGSLRQRLQAGPLAPAQLRELIAGLAGALQAVHAQQLIHRDLKPENLLLRSTEPLEVVLTDFGIASVQDATLRFTSAARTLAYGAPESLAGVLDAKADYWAMGLILLEAAQGEHPFAGLSDAVLLHRLTTRAIDLGGVRDERLRMLLRGLLLRDPQARWGAEELRRWLDGDPTQAEPVEQGGSLGARQPYRIGEDECFTPDQLAVALARHWPLALADVDNGQLMRWLRVELQDHNSVRLLIDLNEQRHLSTDARLLRLLLHLAPGLPAVWRGQGLSLGTVLGWASQTLKGDAPSAERLLDMQRQGVLAAYAQAGHPELADLHQRWQAALQSFETEWQTALALLAKRPPTTAADSSVDDLLYGPQSNIRRPLPELLHARLLALSFDAGWTARLRRYLAPELQRLRPDAPWLNALGDAAQCSPAGLLVLHALLPEAQRCATQAERRRQAEQAQRLSDIEDLEERAQQLQDAVQDAARPPFFDREACDALHLALADYARLTEHVRALGWPQAGLQALRLRLLRQEASLLRLRQLNQELLARLVANRGWFSPWVLLAVLMLASLAGNLLGSDWGSLVLGLAAGTALWRWLPVWWLARRIRRAPLAPQALPAARSHAAQAPPKP